MRLTQGAIATRDPVATNRRSRLDVVDQCGSTEAVAICLQNYWILNPIA
jgi:hypothetical protein